MVGAGLLAPEEAQEAPCCSTYEEAAPFLGWAPGCLHPSNQQYPATLSGVGISEATG